jgi:tRNA-specific 2-thiouridylase
VIAQLRFPVGDLTKAEVRRRARALGLVTADKPESQEICFVPDNDYGEFLGTRLGAEHPSLMPGPLVTREGAVVGEHAGYARYTIGQRRGLGGGRGAPLYVLAVRPGRNQIVVGTEEELYADSVILNDLNWIDSPPQTGEVLQVQLRHRATAAAATATHVDDDVLHLALATPQRAVTPGQSGAVYRGEQLVGGGRIRGTD